MNNQNTKKRYWQFYFLNPKKYQMINKYHYLDVETEPTHEYDGRAFEKDYKNSDFPQDKYYSVRNIEIVEEKYFE